MSRDVRVVLVDDLNGQEASETVSFGLDGVTYEIDLTEENAQSLRDTLAAWIAAGRPAEIRIPQARAKPHGVPSEAADIRRWAEQEGIPVAARGRISADLRARFEAAHA